MTATEKLRAMLDERGVEWTDGGVFHRTHWVIDGIHYVAFEQGGKLYLQSSIGPLIPEQAITATLGAETCHADETDVIKCWVKCKDEPSTEHVELIHVMECSACGGTYEYVNGCYEFCPRCGVKVVAE